jgi:3-methyl-2-oxobutanoate hydroxymethyltransferase
MNKILNTRNIRLFKKTLEKRSLEMLTCYDFQSAQVLNETDLDLILVGDSLGNVILGYDSTVEVSLEEMIIFSSAVKRGAKNKFVIADLPFGTYATLPQAIENSTKLFSKSKVEALKLEGAYPWQCEIIKHLTEIGMPMMGHIGLTPQSVHQLGGYYTHGKNQIDADRLMKEAKALEAAGVFALVLECVEASVAKEITEALAIPTIGIGSGKDTDGQVLVINDLLKMGANMPPKFCSPVADFYKLKKDYIQNYLDQSKVRNTHVLPLNN